MNWWRWPIEWRTLSGFLPVGAVECYGFLMFISVSGCTCVWLAHTHAHTHALTHTCTHTHMHSHTHALTHTCTHTHMHSHTHAHTHMHTHMPFHTENQRDEKIRYIYILMPETFRSENRQRYVCACQNKEDKSLMKATPDLAWPALREPAVVQLFSQASERFQSVENQRRTCITGQHTFHHTRLSHLPCQLHSV